MCVGSVAESLSHNLDTDFTMWLFEMIHTKCYSLKRTANCLIDITNLPKEHTTNTLRKFSNFISIVLGQHNAEPDNQNLFCVLKIRLKYNHKGPARCESKCHVHQSGSTSLKWPGRNIYTHTHTPAEFSSIVKQVQTHLHTIVHTRT